MKTSSIPMSRRLRLGCLLLLLNTVPIVTGNGATEPARVNPPRFDGEDVVFSWNSGGDLQVAPTPSGPWTTVAVPQFKESEARLPALRDGNLFFRIVDHGVPGEPHPIVEGDPMNPFRMDRVLLFPPSDPGRPLRIEVEFEPGQNVPTLLPLQFDDRPVVLRDDGTEGDREAGDGIHSAFLFFDPEELSAANEFLASLPEEFQIVGTFFGRSVLDAHPPSLFDMEALDRGEPIQLHPSPLWINPEDSQPGDPVGPTSIRKTLAELIHEDKIQVTNPGTPSDTVVVVGPPVRPGPIGELIARPGFADKSLLITDLSVVEDPSRTFDPCTGRGTPLGAWTFGRLMIDMANEPVTGIHASDFTRRWLRSWQSDQVINFDLVKNRNPEILAQVIAGWEAASGGPDQPLDLRIAPFRLLAIVNRVDLRGNPGYGGTVGDDPCNPPCVGGEGRFVFGLIPNAFGGRPPGSGPYQGGPTGNPEECGESPFTVIFEYCVPKRTCSEIQAWGFAWFQLSQMPFGPAFNQHLQMLTDQFATAGADPSRHPNRSALSQLRANELLTEPWDMREWRLFATDSDAGWLRQVTVKQTPSITHNEMPIIAEYCLAEAGAILMEQHGVPLEFKGPGQPKVPFLGGNAPMDTTLFFWDGPPPAATSIPSEVRHKFSLNTCNGCHAGETGTPFTHVFPRSPGQESLLSDFLTGDNMPKLDPADGVTPRYFADLKRREDDLLRLIIEPCFFQLFHIPVSFAH